MTSALRTQPSPLLALDPDVLTVVLSRTCAADHASLRMTCTRLRDILDSSTFKKQRAVTGHSEIQAIISPPFRLGEGIPSEENGDPKGGDDSCGFQNKKAHILVDGLKAGEVSLTELPRESFSNFHSFPSGDYSFAEIIRLLFDSVGEPRHQTMKNALGKAGNRYGLLFINHFTIYDPLHRGSSLTGARALRSLLEDRALKERYSVVVHVPDAVEHTAGREADYVKKRDHIGQASDFAKKYMQQFFRAGFRRIPETIDSDWFHVFAVPEFLDSPLLSEEEAMSMQDLETAASLKKMALNKDALHLFEMIEDYCSARESMVKDLLFMQRNSGCLPRGKRTADKWALQCALSRYRLMEDEADRQLEDLEHNTQSNKSLLDNGDMKIYHGLTSIAATLVGVEDGDNLKYVLQQRFNHLDEELKEFRYQLQKLRARRRNAELNFHFAEFPIACQKAKLQELDERTRYQLQRLLDVHGIEVIVKSNVLHFCALNLLPDVIQLVMAGVPNEDKKRVVNALDHQGQTPLMEAANIQNNFHRYANKIRVETIEMLLELGADTTIVDALGLTALGHFRKTLQRVQECVSSEESYIQGKNIRAQMEAAPSMEVLLWPDGGPSAVDRTFLRLEQSNSC